MYARNPAGMVAKLLQGLFRFGKVGRSSRSWPKRMASKGGGGISPNVAGVIYVYYVSIHLRVLIAALCFSRVISFSLLLRDVFRPPINGNSIVLSPDLVW